MLENLNNIKVVYEIVVPEPGVGIIKSDFPVKQDDTKYPKHNSDVDLIETNIDIENVAVTYEEVEGEIYKSIQETLKQFSEFEVLFTDGNPPIFIPVEDKNNPIEQGNIINDINDKNLPSWMLAEIENENKNKSKGVIDDADLNRSEAIDLPKWMLDMISNETHYDEQTKSDSTDLPLWMMQEIDTDESGLTEKSKPIEMEGQEWRAKEASMMQKINSFLEKLPNQPDSKKRIDETIQLLDDIQLFGDEREIPLLQELLKKEDKKETKTRIDALMRRFMGGDVYSSLPVLTAPYSVFEELFRSCDTESKLILLNEIVDVGNYKEVYFLEKLISDPNAEIRKKAKKCLVQLKKKCADSLAELQKEDDDAYDQLLKGMELDPPKDSNLFNIEFSFWDTDTEPIDAPKNQVIAESKIITFISNLINKLPF